MIQRFISLILGLLWVSGLMLSLPAYAETWTQVVTSADGYEEQYVDIDSIQDKNGMVSLKTYWLDVREPEVATHAVTEYDCDRHLYRDVTLNGKPHQTDWYSLESDPMNRAVMEYSCFEE